MRILSAKDDTGVAEFARKKSLWLMGVSLVIGDPGGQPEVVSTNRQQRGRTNEKIDSFGRYILSLPIPFAPGVDAAVGVERLGEYDLVRFPLTGFGSGPAPRKIQRSTE